MRVAFILICSFKFVCFSLVPPLAHALAKNIHVRDGENRDDGEEWREHQKVETRYFQFLIRDYVVDMNYILCATVAGKRPLESHNCGVDSGYHEIVQRDG